MHIPRNGGKWLTYKIRDLGSHIKGVGREVALIDSHPRRYEYVKTGRHGTLQSIYDLVDVDLSGYFKFCISRHPYTRFQSAFTYYVNESQTSKNAGFNTPRQMMEWLEKNGATKNHVFLQSHWADDRFDKVFRFEDIEKIDFSKYVPEMSNYDKRSNPIVKTEYQEELDDDIKERVYKFYRKDFDRFGYQP